MTHFTSLFRKLSGFGQTQDAPKAKAADRSFASEYAQTDAAPQQAVSDAPHTHSVFPDLRPCDSGRRVFHAKPAYQPTTAPTPKPHKTTPPKTTTNNAAPTNLSIPCPDPTGEERTRDHHQNRALKLARQEDWEALSGLIRAADQSNEMTPGGMSVAELMAFGARADVVLAVEHALLDRTPERDAPLLRGIEALEYVLAENSDDYVIGCIVAQTHMDMAWSWRGIGWDVEIAPRNREAFDAHFSRARDIVAGFAGRHETSALMASTGCALMRGDKCSTKSVADRYEALIDLNPLNIAPLRALGTHMLPRWYGSHAQLELEARRTAARTQDVWGAGAYAWVMFDAISVDDMACAQLDLPFFIEGLHDIVARRPEPHTINLLAAYCANTMGQAFSGNDDADHIRAQIAACADWIVREHLTELHPMIWAHAAQGFANNLRVASATRFAAAGQDDALRIIAGLFRREIAEGKQIIFTDQGVVATPA
ncbi:hypothetical protein ABMC88_11220 [Sulfitobacter sp. HNIBRBA2951]|uniref:hypothetical protein n=1 Tax=Sulfitobacter aquimarinus TaxID=3158557 RepID=UPI0032DFF948